MITISVANDFDRFAKSVDDLRLKQLPFAASRALTDTAREAANTITKSMQSIFDRPTPFTVNSLAVIPARKESLVAVVLVKDQQAKYLAIEEAGGTRTGAMNSRKSSAALTIPGVAARLDAYGNLPAGYQARLRRLAAQVAQTKRAGGMRDTGVAYFRGKGPDNRGPGGYFKRMPGHHITRLTGFEQSERYKPIFGFRRRVELVASQTFRVALMRRLREAVASAR